MRRGGRPAQGGYVGLDRRDPRGPSRETPSTAHDVDEVTVAGDVRGVAEPANA